MLPSHFPSVLGSSLCAGEEWCPLRLHICGKLSRVRRFPYYLHQPVSLALASLFLCCFRKETPYLSLLTLSESYQLFPITYLVNNCLVPYCIVSPWGSNSGKAALALWGSRRDTLSQSKELSVVGAMAYFLAFSSSPLLPQPVINLTSFAFCRIHYSYGHLRWV